MPRVLWRWTGHVTDRDERTGTLWLVMRDLTDPTYPDEQWEVERRKLHPSFWRAATKGRYVDATCYADRLALTMRRVKRWTAGDLGRAVARARRLARIFGEGMR